MVDLDSVKQDIAERIKDKCRELALIVEEGKELGLTTNITIDSQLRGGTRVSLSVMNVNLYASMDAQIFLPEKL